MNPAVELAVTFVGGFIGGVATVFACIDMLGDELPNHHHTHYHDDTETHEEGQQ